MCRSIHTLYNVEPPITGEEIHAATLQFVRKISGMNRPSKVNEAAFLTAVDEIQAASTKLLSNLTTSVPARESKGYRRRSTLQVNQADKPRV